jgi:HK97 family phage major capsid protein
MTITAMIEKRKLLWQENKSLLDKAIEVGRDFTTSEQQEWDKRDGEIDSLNAMEKRARRSDKVEESFEERIDSGIRPTIDKAEDFGNDTRGGCRSDAKTSSSETWVDRKTGKKVCVLGKGDSFRSAVCHRDVDDFGGLRLGDYCRSMVMGGRTPAEKRALSEGSDSAGGFMVPSVLMPDFVDALRSASVVFRAGASTVPLETDSTTIAKLLTDPTASWHSENATVTASDPTFGAVAFAPKTLIALIRVSRELAEDAPNFARAIEMAFAGALGAELDRVVLRGSGSAPEPQGLDGLTDANVVSMGTNGLALTNFDPIVDLIQLIKDDDVELPISAMIMAPRTWAELAKLKDSQNQPLQKPDAVAGIPSLTTTNVLVTDTKGTSTDASKIYMGHWPDALIGIRTEMRIETLKERFADNHQLGFVAHLRADVQFRQAKSMGFVEGLIP